VAVRIGVLAGAAVAMTTMMAAQGPCYQLVVVPG